MKVNPLPHAEEFKLIKDLCPELEESKLRKLFDVAMATRTGGDNTLGSSVSLSTRQPVNHTLQIKMACSNIWIRDVVLLSDPITLGVEVPNQNTSRIQHTGKV